MVFLIDYLKKDKPRELFIVTQVETGLVTIKKFENQLRAASYQVKPEQLTPVKSSVSLSSVIMDVSDNENNSQTEDLLQQDTQPVPQPTMATKTPTLNVEPEVNPELEVSQVTRPSRKAKQRAKQLFKQILRVHSTQHFKHAWIYDPTCHDHTQPAYLITLLQPVNQPTCDANDSLSQQNDLHPDPSDSFTSCPEQLTSSNDNSEHASPSSSPSVPTNTNTIGNSRYTRAQNQVELMLQSVPNPDLTRPAILNSELDQIQLTLPTETSARRSARVQQQDKVNYQTFHTTGRK